MTALQLDDVKPGDKLLCDEAFTCTTPGVPYVVASDGDAMYISCRHGRHYLDGQKQDDGTLAGMVRITED